MYHKVLGTLLVLLVATASTHDVPGERIGEHLLTTILRGLLEGQDPYYLGDVYNLNMTTDLTRVLFNATDVEVGGLPEIEVTKFDPPKLTSKMATLDLLFATFSLTSDNCTINGTYDGHKKLSSQAGSLVEKQLKLVMTFEVESFKPYPLSICLKEGSLVVLCTAESVEGQEEVSKDLSDHGEAVTKALDQWFKENSDFILDYLNQGLCK